MKRYMQIMKKSKIFSGISEDELPSMLKCLGAVEKSFGKGDYIYRIGEQISEVALLVEGSVHIQKSDYWGNLSIINRVMPGEVFAEAYAVPGSSVMVNDAVASADSVVIFLNFRRILTMCSSTCRFHYQLLQNYFVILADKNRLLTQKIEHMSQRTTREKLLSYLSEQSQKACSASFTIPFNRQQLADFLAIDRSAMSNELSKMRKEGILEFEKNQFTLKELSDQR